MDSLTKPRLRVKESGFARLVCESRMGCLRIFCKIFVWSFARTFQFDVLTTIVCQVGSSLASHTLRRREEGSGHAATIELSPRQKLVVTNQIRALCRSHSLSWSTITSQRV